MSDFNRKLTTENINKTIENLRYYEMLARIDAETHTSASDYYQAAARGYNYAIALLMSYEGANVAQATENAYQSLKRSVADYQQQALDDVMKEYNYK